MNPYTFNLNNGINTIRLVWKAQLHDENHRRLLYDRVKTPSEDLKTFIKEERDNGKEIYMTIFINSIDLEFWLNTNLFRKKIIGRELKNKLCLAFNHFKFNKIDFNFQDFLLKQFMGKKISYQDAQDNGAYFLKMAYKKTPAELNDQVVKDYADSVFNSKNDDVVLYLGDKNAGYYGLSVAESEDRIMWKLPVWNGSVLKLSFDKEQYQEAFSEYEEMIKEGLEAM